MKKIILGLSLLLFVGVSVNAQKKSGTIYSEHKSIDASRGLWAAFADGDGDKYASYFADSVYFIINGELPEGKTPNSELAKGIEWWSENYSNLEVRDDKPAYPDALEYKDGGTWAQDWIMVTGVHNESGIRLNMRIHNLYSFDSKGKVQMMHRYFNNDTFEKIRNSSTKTGNGKVYINHPYIAVTRKVVNANIDKDLEAYKSYFSPNARFGHYGLEFGKTLSYEENMEEFKEAISSSDSKISVEEIGYPDCVFYEKGSQYVVYSWWKVTRMTKGEKDVYSVMLTHNFDDEGKIVFENVNLSSKRSK